MIKTRFKATDRFLAVLLALIMVIGMMPVTVFAAAEDYPDNFIITVKDDAQGAVADAEISYEIKVDGVSQGLNSIKTDSDGTAGIDLTAFEAQIVGSETITLLYTISKEGFKTKSDEIPVNSKTDTLDVELEAEDPEMIQITVSATGDGTVTLNGASATSLSVEKGEKVTVVVTPGDNARIDLLSIKGVDESVDNRYEAYTTTVDADSDIQINAVFITEVTVTANSNEGGTVKLNEQEESSITVDKGSQVTVVVEPNEGYQISSVTIGGDSKTVSDLHSYFDTIIVDSDVAISVQFVKEYTVTISKTGNGDFTTSPDNISGSVTVEAGISMTVTATPNENYRVSKVIINGTETVFDGNEHDYANPYVTELTVT